MLTIGMLLKISRPRFWLYTAGPFLLGYILGLPAGFRQMYPLTFWLLFLYFLLPANVFLYGINDLFDRETDALNGKKDSQEHRLAAQEQRSLIAVLAVSVILSVAVLAVIPVGGWWLIVLFLLFSVFYSTPPLRFKTRPIIDSYSNLLYVLPGFLGYWLTAQRFPPVAVVVGAICWAAGMHAYSAIPDIEPDRQSGVWTVAVLLGRQGTLLFVTLNWIIFAGVIIGITGRQGIIALLYPTIPALLYFRERWNVARVYWWFPALNGLFGFLVFVCKTLH